MKAVRNRRADGREWIKHWLVDDGWTVCGRHVLRFEAAAIIDVETLGSEACDVCLELAQRPAMPKANPVAYFLGPSHGRLVKEGPLYHGFKNLNRKGQRLR